MLLLSSRVGQAGNCIIQSVEFAAKWCWYFTRCRIFYLPAVQTYIICIFWTRLPPSSDRVGITKNILSWHQNRCSCSASRQVMRTMGNRHVVQGAYHLSVSFIHLVTLGILFHSCHNFDRICYKAALVFHNVSHLIFVSTDTQHRPGMPYGYLSYILYAPPRPPPKELQLSGTWVTASQYLDESKFPLTKRLTG